MKLSIKNVGRLKEADVEINGITIIAGENNTGKSTVGKVLWSIFSSFYKINEQIAIEKQESIEKVIFNSFLDSMYQYNMGYLDPFYNEEKEKENIKKVSKKIVNTFENIKDDTELKYYLINTLNKIIYSDVNASNYKIDEIVKILRITNDRIGEIAILKRLLKEFNNQINNIYSEAEAEMELIIKDKSLKIVIEDNKIKDLREDIYVNTEVFYIDDPHIVDELEEISMEKIKFSHRGQLIENLLNVEKESVINELLAEDRWEKINDKLNDIIQGKFTRKKNGRSFFYEEKNGYEKINVKNLSMGLKVFTIIKLLIQNNSLKENGTIILDEPEIHLHPEWQIKFAELIVLLQKEFGMHILLTTHSPYFLKAIQVYSKKYEISDKCKYYMSELDGEQAILVDKTSKTDDLFYKLAISFENLMNEEELYED